MQSPILQGGASAQAPPDSSAGIEGIGKAVDRVTEVRSFSDLWSVAGDFRQDLLRFGAELVVALIVLIAFFGLYLAVMAAVRPVFERSRLEEDARQLLESLIKYGILGFGLILALDQLGFNVTSLLAGLGVAGLALGFAAKDTLANFIAGITILWDRPFRVGDRVEVDEEFGQVKRITLRSTRIHTNDNRVVIIPNQNVANNKIVNHTMQAALRLVVEFGIAYKEDTRQAREVVLGLVAGDDRIRGRPAPEVVLTELGDSSVNMALRCWLKNPHQEVELSFEYREKIKRALDAAGISIPFPHLSLFVEKLPRGAAAEGPVEEEEPAAGEPEGE